MKEEIDNNKKFSVDAKAYFCISVSRNADACNTESVRNYLKFYSQRYCGTRLRFLTQISKRYIRNNNNNNNNNNNTVIIIIIIIIIILLQQ